MVFYVEISIGTGGLVGLDEEDITRWGWEIRTHAQDQKKSIHIMDCLYALHKTSYKTGEGIETTRD